MKQPDWRPVIVLAPECRHRRFVAFRDAWTSGNPRLAGTGRVKAEMLDARLHAERVGRDNSKPTFRARLDELPDGVFVIGNGDGEGPSLLWLGNILAWSPGGYSRARVRKRRGGRGADTAFDRASDLRRLRARRPSDSEPAMTRNVSITRRHGKPPSRRGRNRRHINNSFGQLFFAQFAGLVVKNLRLKLGGVKFAVQQLADTDPLLFEQIRDE